jgi:hypothetical protein
LSSVLTAGSNIRNPKYLPVNTTYRLTLIPLLATVLITASPEVVANEYDSVGDSTVAARKKISHARITARIQSLGIFNYGGLVANSNPVFDVNFTYDRKTWGCMLFKAFDLYDAHSPYNFTLATVYKNIHISKQLTFTPFAGFVLEQERKIADPGSDGVVFLITSWKAAPHFTIEHCARFSNTIVDRQQFDWLNRFRASYSREHFDLSASAWRNNKVFDNNTYTTLGMSVGYNRVKISEHVKLNTSLSAIVVASMLPEDDEWSRNGLVFTFGVTVD